MDRERWRRCSGEDIAVSATRQVLGAADTSIGAADASFGALPALMLGGAGNVGGVPPPRLATSPLLAGSGAGVNAGLWLAPPPPPPPPDDAHLASLQAAFARASITQPAATMPPAPLPPQEQELATVAAARSWAAVAARTMPSSDDPSPLT